MPGPQKKPMRETKKEPVKKPKTVFTRFKIMLNGIFRPGKKPDLPEIREEEKYFNWTTGVDR